MKRLLYLFLATALAGTWILAAVGCSTNPVTSQVVVESSDQQQETVADENVSDDNSGGYPATTTTTIEKYESDEEALYLNRTP